MSNDAPGNGSDATVREFASGQKLFRRFTLKRTLGRGGMGIVWLARDDELERDVALKFLPDLIIHDRAVLSDLKRETRRSLELTHKNIVRIYDFVHDDVNGCISMEYVDGDTLSNLRADKPKKIFEPEELKEWVSELCDALDYAHNHARIVHRDLKPANLMVNQRGDLKVADFGIARSLSDSMSMLTMDRGKSGTLLYMSPQQLDGERGNHLDDVYSLGASVYELLTSKPPFYSGNVDRQIREKVPPPMTQRRGELDVDGGHIDERWENLVRRCLAKDPAQRPQSVSEVANLLSVPSPKTRRAKRIEDANESPKRSTGVLAAVALVLILGAGGWFVFQMMQKSTPAKSTSAPTHIVPTIPASPPPAPPIAPPVVSGMVLDSSPSGATVFLGGKEVGKTPLSLNHVSPGKYAVKVVLDGYEPVERQVEVKDNEFNNLGSIALTPARASIELTTVPSGATVFLDNMTFVGTTPLRRNDLTPGDVTYLLFLNGYLPREVKAKLDPRQAFKQEVPLVQAAPLYIGVVRQKNGSVYNVPVTIAPAPDMKSGTMTQTGRKGEIVVKYAGVWDRATLRAVTNEVVSKPSAIIWEPEAFALQFSDDGKTATYQCDADGKAYVADLTAHTLGSTMAKVNSVYKGVISGGTRLTIAFAPDRQSGTMTETAKNGGDVVVRFSGIWDGAILRAVTTDVVSKPANLRWDPESFTLRFSEDGRSGSYECSADGKYYTGQLSPP